MTYKEKQLLSQAVYIINQLEMGFAAAEEKDKHFFKQIRKPSRDEMIRLFLPNYLYDDSKKFMRQFMSCVKKE